MEKRKISSSRCRKIVLIISFVQMCQPLIVALPGVRPARGRIREQARGRQVLQVPFGRAFRPPGPEDPARMLLVGVELGVDEVLQIVLVGRTETVNRACGFAVAGADVA